MVDINGDDSGDRSKKMIKRPEARLFEHNQISY